MGLVKGWSFTAITTNELLNSLTATLHDFPDKHCFPSLRRPFLAILYEWNHTHAVFVCGFFPTAHAVNPDTARIAFPLDS